MTKLESDTEKIRERPLMFIGLLGSKGACHVCREAINNHIDECSKPDTVTPGNTVWIEFNEKLDMMVSSDNGRGINPDEVVDIFTTLNMGSNMTRSHGYTLGENGVGSLCITALAREAVIETHRSLHEKTVSTFTFREGKLVDQHSEPDKEKHGLVVMYKPSRKVFGQDAHIDIDEMTNWVRSFKYRMAEKLTMHMKVVRANGTTEEETITPVPFRNIIVDNNTDLIFEPEMFVMDGEMDEEFGGSIQNRTFHIDIAFGYTKDEEPYQSSFCNGAYTTDNGSHVEGVINGIVRYLREATQKTIGDSEKITVQPSDITMGLTISVNLMTDMMKLFVSQIKTKVDNTKLARQLSNMVYQKMSELSKTTIKQYVDMVKTNAKARVEANLLRQRALKEQTGKWDRYSIEQLIPCASNDHTKTELYICEGLSAKGSLRIARNAEYQAIFSIRGFPLNPYGKSLSQILNNAEYKALVATLGCGIGDSFNMNKLKYSKIIISTDADVDGWGIRSIMASFFILFYPEIVADKRLYVADPPLYWIDYPPQEYVTTKKVYYDISEHIYDKRWRQVQQDAQGNWVPVKDSTLFRDAVDFSRQFRLADIYRMNRDVIFSIISQTAHHLEKHDYPNNLSQQEFVQMIHSISYRFTGDMREIRYTTYDNYIAFNGVYNLKYVGLDFTYATFTRLTPLFNIARRLRIWEKIYIQDIKSHEVLTGIAEDPMKVIETVTSLMPRIKDRMKGLGQTDKTILARTTLDPETRTLIQIDLQDDFTTALEVIKSLRGSSIEDLHKRREMISTFDIDIDDIDT